MSQKLFEEKLMEEYDLKDWKEVVKKGVGILVNNKYAKTSLVDAIFKSTSEFGAYYVLERGIALLHAKPADYALKPGVSFILLKKEVQFNNEDKYARLIFTLSAPDSKSHIGLIEEFGEIFTNVSLKEKLLKAKNLLEVQKLIKEYKKG